MKKSPQRLRRCRTTGALIASLGWFWPPVAVTLKTNTPATSLRRSQPPPPRLRIRLFPLGLVHFGMFDLG